MTTPAVTIRQAATLLEGQLAGVPWFLDATVWGAPTDEYLVLRATTTSAPEMRLLRRGWLGHRVVVARTGGGRCSG